MCQRECGATQMGFTYITEADRRVDSLHSNNDIVQLLGGVATAEKAALDRSVDLGGTLAHTMIQEV